MIPALCGEIRAGNGDLTIPFEQNIVLLLARGDYFDNVMFRL